MSDVPTGDTSLKDVLVWFIVGGGASMLVTEVRQWWVRRRQLSAVAPEHRAAAESKMVATADKVVELVEERMNAQAAEIRELKAEIRAVRDEATAEIRAVRDEATAEVRVVRDEARELRGRVSVLEDELRKHNIPLP